MLGSPPKKTIVSLPSSKTHLPMLTPSPNIHPNDKKNEKRMSIYFRYILSNLTTTLITTPPNFSSSTVERKTNSKQELFRKHIFLALTPHPKWVFLKPSKGVGAGGATEEEEKKPQHYFHVSLNNIAVHNQNQFHFLWVKKENHWENKKNISTSLRKLWKCAKKAHQRFRF